MKCPGQDTQFWKPGDVYEVNCPSCGKSVEFFKDDPKRKCTYCGHYFVNPKLDFGCAAYCPYAEQCIGNLPSELILQKENLLKDRVAVEMKKYFQKDFKRIGHASKVSRYAEKIALKEKDADLSVVLCSAYLHDIGIHEAERKYNSTAPKYQEKEGPEIARSILNKLNADSKLIDEVCDIVGHHHHPREVETINFKILYDADLITNLEETHKNNPISKERFLKILDKSFLTTNGSLLANEVIKIDSVDKVD